MQKKQNRSVSPRLAAAVAAALGAGTMSTQVSAQQAYTDEGTPLETIIVSATRRDVNVQDVPFNMVALGPQALDDLRITNLAEFTRAVPGLYVPNQGARGSNLLTVRGLNVTFAQRHGPARQLGRGHGRHVPGGHPALRRPRDDRRRAHRGPARAAGHAVRRGHARRGDPLPAEPARSVADGGRSRWQRFLAGPERRLRRGRLGSRQRAARAGSGRAAHRGRLHRRSGVRRLSLRRAGTRRLESECAVRRLRRRRLGEPAQGRGRRHRGNLQRAARPVLAADRRAGGELHLLLPGSAGRRPHGQSRRGARHGTLRLRQPLPGAERPDQPPVRARTRLGPGLRRADLCDRQFQIRVVRTARPDRLPDGPGLRLRGLPAIRGVRDRRPRREDVQPGAAARVAGHGEVELDRGRVLSITTRATRSPRNTRPAFPRGTGSPRISRTSNTAPPPTGRSRRWRCSASSVTRSPSDGRSRSARAGSTTTTSCRCVTEFPFFDNGAAATTTRPATTRRSSSSTRRSRSRPT